MKYEYVICQDAESKILSCCSGHFPLHSETPANFSHRLETNTDIHLGENRFLGHECAGEVFLNA